MGLLDATTLVQAPEVPFTRAMFGNGATAKGAGGAGILHVSVGPVVRAMPPFFVATGSFNIMVLSGALAVALRCRLAF